MKVAAIFRHQLFKGSEPFIVQQAQHLKTYRPVYVGRERQGAEPEAADVLALSDCARERTMHRRIWVAATRDPRPYVKLLNANELALIHAHFGVEGVYALRVAKVLSVPLITTFHGFDATLSAAALLTAGSPAWINYVLFRRQLAENGRLFLCVSEFVRSHVCALGFPEERTLLHYIGIDVQNVRPREPGEEEPIVLHVARLVEKKGTRYLLRAFAGCISRHPRLRLVIVGDGPLRADLECLARSLSLGERVSFLGPLPHDEVMSWIRRASVLALPSVRARNGDAEGLGMVLLEAAACGVPVLGSRHGGIPEAVAHGQTGYLVGERDTAGLTRRLDELMRNGEMRRQMGARGRRLIEERFDIRRQAMKLEALYDSVVSCRARS